MSSDRVVIHGRILPIALLEGKTGGTLPRLS
jgi:hypothetical protein